jgi:hypothetical protein
MIDVAMVNRAASIITDHAARATLSAFQEWLDDALVPAWGLEPVKLHYVAAHEKIPHGGVWPLYLLFSSDVPGALGYHEDTGSVPDGKVFVGDAMKDGISWTVDFGHELGEMLVDPKTDRWIPLPGMPGWKVIVEVGDPVEADQFGMTIDGVLMTDFVLPEYFGLTPQAGFHGFDWQHRLAAAAPSLLDGGYISLQDPQGNLKQLFARRADKSVSPRVTRVSRVFR